MNKEQQKKKEEKVEDKEVILIKPYKVLESASSTSSSFIDKKIDNLLKYMKFIKSLIQTRIFQPPLYYQALQSRGEQDPDFWKEVATALCYELSPLELGKRTNSCIRVNIRELNE